MGLDDVSEVERVRAIAADVLDRRASIVSVELAEHGLSNRTWLVTTARGGVVVRLDSGESERLLVDRQSEMAVLTVAAAAGIGPRVLRCEHGILVTELVEGSPWSLEYVRQPAGIARIAELLRQVHALSPADGIRRIDVTMVIQHYWKQLFTSTERRAVGGEARLQAMLELAASLHSTRRLRLCHNDIHHLNLMDDGRLRLLDWEYAGIGDADFDLAGVCCYHDYEPEQRKQLLAHYASATSDDRLARLDRVCALFRYVSDLWFAVRAQARV